jgi:hypothetical protein
VCSVLACSCPVDLHAAPSCTQRNRHHELEGPLCSTDRRSGVSS